MSKRPRSEEEEEDEEDEDLTSPPSGEKKGRRKINIEFIEDKNRRHITFSKRKAGIMKKAYELSTLTGTQVLLLVASETGHVYTFATPKLQPLITKPEGKNLIQTCLNAPDPSQMQGLEGAPYEEEAEEESAQYQDRRKMEQYPMHDYGIPAYQFNYPPQQMQQFLPIQQHQQHPQDGMYGGK